MSVRRSLVVGLGLSLVAPFVGPGGAGATPVGPPPTAQSVVAGAKTWLLTQQQADGGFEVSGFPGFETPDAILAVATASQSGGGAWNTSLARATVANELNASNKDPLDAIDDLVETGDTTTQAKAAQAAKIIALVANPLGIDPTDFDPSNDSAEAVNLVARVQAYVKDDGTLDLASYFNGVLYTAIAFKGAGITEPSGLLAQIEAAQRPDGSWNYAGNQDAATDGDIDTTSTALVALKALGVDKSDAHVKAGITYLAGLQVADGAWQSFGSDDPNSTAVATMALSAQHVDVTSASWRAPYGVATPVGAYPGPYQWLLTQQAADGHITSANDSFPPISTFATTQSMQALASQWYLAGDRQALVEQLATRLASPQAGPTSALAESQLYASVGDNPSTTARRAGAATGIVSSTYGREAAAADLFQQALGRAIDPSGRRYWSTKLITITRPQMLSRLTGSAEFYRHAGSTTGGFVDAVYQSVLGRAADPSGRAHWIAKIDGGDSVSHVAQSLVASTEYRRKSVDAAYQRVLGRAADPSGRTYWTAKVAKTRIEVLLASLASSDEFYRKASTEG